MYRKLSQSSAFPDQFRFLAEKIGIPQWKQEAGAVIIQFYYPKKLLLEEVKKRTSYIGGHRSAETQPHLLDEIAFTEDEINLFEQYATEAIADMYNELACLYKDVHYGAGTIYFETIQADDLYQAFDGAEFMIEQSRWLKDIVVPAMDAAILDCLCFNIIYQWLMVAYPSEVQTILPVYNEHLIHLRELALRRKVNGTAIMKN